MASEICRKAKQYIYEDEKHMGLIFKMTCIPTKNEYILCTYNKLKIRLRSLKSASYNYDGSFQRNPLYWELKKYKMDNFEIQEIKKVPFLGAENLELMTQRIRNGL